jgi:hypothetical protein
MDGLRQLSSERDIERFWLGNSPNFDQIRDKMSSNREVIILLVPTLREIERYDHVIDLMKRDI